MDRNEFKPIPGSPIGRMVAQSLPKNTVRIPLNQIINLSRCELKLEALPLKQWDQYFNILFNVNLTSPQFNRYFKTPEQLLFRKYPEDFNGTVTETTALSIYMQICAKIGGLAYQHFHLKATEEETVLAGSLFIELKTASLRLIAAQKNGGDIPLIIKESNQSLRNFAEEGRMSYIIQIS